MLAFGGFSGLLCGYCNLGDRLIQNQGLSQLWAFEHLSTVIHVMLSLYILEISLKIQYKLLDPL